MTVRFTVFGTPAPQGSKSFKGFSKAGHAILAESSQQVRPWRDAVGWAVREAMAGGHEASAEGTVVWRPISGPVSATIVFTLPRPKSAPKKQLWPYRQPDVDKLARAVFDSLKDGRVIEDDARIVRLEAWKVFPRPWGFPQTCINADGWLRGFELNTPGAVIEIRNL